MLDTQKRENESFNEYLLRISDLRDSEDLTWQQVADIINNELGFNHTEACYRRKIKFLHDVQEKALSASVDDMLLELRKEKVKLSDERTQINAYVRKLSREDTIKDIAYEVADKLNNKKLLPEVKKNSYKLTRNDHVGILEIGDWHYGIVCDNFHNTYNPEIAKKRVAQLRDDVISYCSKWGVKELHVLNLADLIAGRIHLTIRLESRFDVITQVIEVSEILAEMLNKLSETMTVHYYDCLDNHSRLEPNKSDSIDLESLTRITPWFLKERLKNSNVVFHNNEYGPDIISFKVFDYDVLGIHGHQDKPLDAIAKLEPYIGKHFDLVCIAHKHHFSVDEQCGSIVVATGSLMGTDSYASKLRLHSKPSQNLIIVSDKNPVECIHKINLD